MKKFNWLTAFLLNFVTCGIYTLYMFYKITQNNNTVAKKYGQKEIQGFIVAFLLGIITCSIYLIYWYYKINEQMVNIQKAKGQTPVLSDSPIVLLILMFVPILNYYVLCENYNQVVDGE